MLVLAVRMLYHSRRAYWACIQETGGDLYHLDKLESLLARFVPHEQWLTDKGYTAHLPKQKLTEEDIDDSIKKVEADRERYRPRS